MATKLQRLQMASEDLDKLSEKSERAREMARQGEAGLEWIREMKGPFLSAIKEGVKEGVALGVNEKTRDEKEEVATDQLIEKLMKAVKQGAQEEDIKRVFKKLLKE
jgi:hypothetical protein